MKIIPEGSTEYIIAKALLGETFSDTNIIPSYVKELHITRVSATDHIGFLIIEQGSRFFKCYFKKMNIEFIPPTLEKVEEVEPRKDYTTVYV